MKFKAFALLLSALAFSDLSLADVECRVYCSGSAACIERQGAMEPMSRGAGWKIQQCDAGDRKILSDAVVSYSRGSMLVVKDLAPAALLASAVKDGDANCGWKPCFRAKSGSMVGGVPVGAGGSSLDSPTFKDAWLPFGEVDAPSGALVLALGASGTGAAFELGDAFGKRIGVFAAPNGRVTIPPKTLNPGDIYVYRWTAAGEAPLNGSFKVAQPGTAPRAQAQAAQGPGAGGSPVRQKLALAKAYMAVGLRWNALLLLEEAERGE